MPRHREITEMSKAENTTVTLEELLVSSFAQTDVLAKLLIEERHHHAAGVFGEDCGGAGHISGDVKADFTLTQMTQLEILR